MNAAMPSFVGGNVAAIELQDRNECIEAWRKQFDENGDRHTPSHANKNGKRYR